MRRDYPNIGHDFAISLRPVSTPKLIATVQPQSGRTGGDRARSREIGVRCAARDRACLFSAPAFGPSASPHSIFSDPRENTNGLLRQYFPKGTDLSAHGADDIAAVAMTLNSRPRKALGRKTPAEALDQYLR